MNLLRVETRTRGHKAVTQQMRARHDACCRDGAVGRGDGAAERRLIGCASCALGRKRSGRDGRAGLMLKGRQRQRGEGNEKVEKSGYMRHTSVHTHTNTYNIHFEDTGLANDSLNLTIPMP